MKNLKGRKIRGGHTCVYQKDDFIVLFTRYGVYQGFYLLETEDGEPYVNKNKTPKADENHFTSLRACLEHFKMI